MLADDLTIVTFPGECRSCEGPLLHAGLIPVCTDCLNRLAPSSLVGCSLCGDALDFDLDLEDVRFAGMLREGLLCHVCRMAPPAFSRAISFGIYQDELRTMIHLLKYDGVRAVAERLAGPLAEAIFSLRREAAAELLVIPVPLFRAAQKRRGFNQSRLLAEAAIRVLRGTEASWNLQLSSGALVRRKSTESQYTLSRKGRRRNLKGAFHVPDAALVEGREVLLVDDIFTTGATARECAAVLLRAGASKVWVATVARAQSERVLRARMATVASWNLKETKDLAEM